MSDHDQPVAAHLLDRRFETTTPNQRGRRYDRVRHQRASRRSPNQPVRTPALQRFAAHLAVELSAATRPTGALNRPCGQPWSIAKSRAGIVRHAGSPPNRSWRVWSTLCTFVVSIPAPSWSTCSVRVSRSCPQRSPRHRSRLDPLKPVANPRAGRHIYDVKSGSGGIASDGTKYSDW
jgi:hypothetical protein